MDPQKQMNGLNPLFTGVFELMFGMEVLQQKLNNVHAGMIDLVKKEFGCTSPNGNQRTQIQNVPFLDYDDHDQQMGRFQDQIRQKIMKFTRIRGTRTRKIRKNL